MYLIQYPPSNIATLEISPIQFINSLKAGKKSFSPASLEEYPEYGQKHFLNDQRTSGTTGNNTGKQFPDKITLKP